MKWLVFLTMISLAVTLNGCGGNRPVSNQCGGDGYAVREGGDDKSKPESWLNRWTRAEKLWAEAHDTKIDENCRR